MAKDTFDLATSLIKGVSDKEVQARQNDARLYRESIKKVSVSPLYARYVGKSITIAFNGNFRKIPVTGEEVEITQGHYNALMKYLRHVDKQINIAQNNARFMGSDATGDFRKI